MPSSALSDPAPSSKDLESRNLLVVPLDRRRDWYRYHHLFRDLLASASTGGEPELIPELHLRAASWCEANDMLETAIDHAQAAGDDERVARLLLKIANPVWASGRVNTVLRWMEWFDANDLVARHPAVAVHGALIFALLGRPGETEPWAVAAEQTHPGGTLADGNTMEATLAYLRTLLCRKGVVEMRRDAQIALKGLTPAKSLPSDHAPRRRVSYLLECGR